MLSTLQVCNNARSVKILVVVPYNALTDRRGVGLTNTGLVLADMFKSRALLQQHAESIIFVVNRFPVRQAVISETDVQRRLQDQWEDLGNAGNPPQDFVDKHRQKCEERLLRDIRKGFENTFTVDEASTHFKNAGLEILQWMHDHGHVLGWHPVPHCVGGQSSAQDILAKLDSLKSIPNTDRDLIGSYARHENSQWLADTLSQLLEGFTQQIQTQKPNLS